MPTVTLNKQVFEKLVGKKLPLEKLKDRISMLGTDLESIEGNEIHVEVFPDRPDMLSEQGFARAFSSFIGVKTGLRKYKVKKSGKKITVDKSVTMRPYTACAIVKNVIFNDERIREVMQIQEKLAATHGRNRRKSCYGLYPMDVIKFPIKYVAKDLKEIKFKPLGYDREMTGAQVERTHPTGKKYSFVAEGWKKYPCYIDDKGSVLSMLPYTNSQDTGKIDETTKEAFIECTGTDLNNVQIALNIFVTMFADMGGDIYSVDLLYPDKKITTPNLSPQKMKFDLNYVNKLIGLNLKETEAKKLLGRMGFGYEKGHVLVPAYRADILHLSDIAEDIAIAYGYENLVPEIPSISTIGSESKFSQFVNKIAHLLTGLQLLETCTYHITDKDSITTKMNLNLDYIELENALTSEYNVLRNWIIPSLIQVLSENKHHEYPQRLFEIGTVFKKDNKTEMGAKEFQRLAVVSSHSEADLTELRQVLDALMRALNLSYEIIEADHPSFIKGRVGRVIVNQKKVAYIGEINPEVLVNFGLEMPVAALELNISEIFNLIYHK